MAADALPAASPQHEPRLRSRAVLLLLVGLLGLGWLAALGISLWRMREDTLAHAQALAATHTRNFEEHLTQTLQVVDLTAGSLEPGPLTQVNALGQRLSVLMRSVPYLRSLSLLDAKGQVVASSNPANVGGRVGLDAFFPPADAQARLLRVGGPWRGRDLAGAALADARSPISVGDPSFVPVLRRLNTDEPLWLVAALNPDYFVQHATQMLDHLQAQVQWLRYDDVLLVSTDATDRPGQAGTAGAAMVGLPATERGAAQQTLTSGRAVISAWRASSRYAAVVAVHLDRQAILAGWTQRARQLGSIMLPILLALSVAGVLLWRRQRKLDTQQRELAREQRLAASVFDSSSDAIVLTSPDARILAVNPAFERITGYRVAEVLGRNPGLLSSGMQSKEFYRRMWEALLGKGHWQGELVNRRKDGSLYTGLATINAVRDDRGALLHYIAITTDITERKRYEAGLLEAKERSEAAAMAKTSFLATMSHEIRTPMNGVLGMTELLLTSELSAEQRTQLDIVRNSAESLLTILNEILDFSKIEAQGVSLESLHFNPEEVVTHLIGLFGARAEAKSLRLSTEIDPQLPHRLVGDPTRLRQILTNLLSNALKFTHVGSIVLRVASGPADAEGKLKLHFEVADTGIGIPADKLEHIFEAFAQADSSTTRNYGGTGLGLAISQRLARAMGGDLTVHSTPGQGSRFCVDIQVHQDLDEVLVSQPGAAAALLPDPHLVPQALNVLIAEDVPTNQLVLRGMLTRLGHHCRMTNDGAEAVAVSALQRFDVILMDMQMPVMGGIEATRAIRAREAATGGGAHVPIVALTANAFAADRQACLAAGMDDFLSKPVKLRDLDAMLRRHAHGPGLAGDAPPAAGAGSITAPHEPALETEPVFARAEVLDSLGGDQALLRDLLQTFGATAGADLVALRRALAAGNGAEARRYAHSIKGSALAVGALRVGQRAARLEQSVQDGQIDTATAGLDDLAAVLAEFTAQSGQGAG